MTVNRSVEELVEEVRGWEGVHLRPLFGWRGFMVGRRVFGCCHPREEPLLVWLKLPEPLWVEAMATAQASPHPFGFRNWLELRAATPEEMETCLRWLHSAYEWVLSGEPPSWDIEEGWP